MPIPDAECLSRPGLLPSLVYLLLVLDEVLPGGWWSYGREVSSDVRVGAVLDEFLPNGWWSSMRLISEFAHTAADLFMLVPGLDLWMCLFLLVSTLLLGMADSSLFASITFPDM